MYNFRKLVKNTEFKTTLQLSVYTWEVFSVLELEAGIPPKHMFLAQFLYFPQTLIFFSINNKTDTLLDLVSQIKRDNYVLF